MLIWEMREQKLTLNDKKRNLAAAAILRKLGTGVDQLREQLRNAKPARACQRLYSDYLLTVQGDTDSASSRQRRAEILRGLLGPLFERKDEKRTFSAEQRRIIWDERRAALLQREELSEKRKAIIVGGRYHRSRPRLDERWADDSTQCADTLHGMQQQERIKLNAHRQECLCHKIHPPPTPQPWLAPSPGVSVRS